MHRPLAVLAAATILALLAPAAPAAAQEAGPVTLTLARQTPWVGPKEPVFQVEVRARNDGDVPLGDLSVALVVSDAVRSRTAFDASLTTDPTLEIAIASRPLLGSLQPGQTRPFAIEIGLRGLADRFGQSLVFPVRVELRSADAPVGVLRSAVVFVYERPGTPLRLSWWWILEHPIAFSPDGRFESTSLERSLAPGGHLLGALSGLLSVTEADRPDPVSVVLSPMLLAQLDRMRSGYTVVVDGTEQEVQPGQAGAGAARNALEVLGRVVRSDGVELVGLPYASPALPALLGSRLSRDVTVQYREGTAEIERLLAVAPVTTTARPPGSSLDDPSLEALAERGATTLLLDAGRLPQTEVEPLGFAPHPTVGVVTADGTAVTAVLPDPGLQARIDAEVVQRDPVLAAQTLLGDLAAIWLERPSVKRAVGLAIPAHEDLPGPFLTALARGISGAPWLKPIAAADLSAAFPPLEDHPVPPYEGLTFDRTYVTALKETRRLVGTLRSMLVEESALPDQLASTLLMAESSEFLGLGELRGRGFIDHVRDRVEAEFSAVGPEPGQFVTLTSSTGSLPVQVRNEGDRTVRVLVELVSPRLRFPAGSTKEIELGTEDVTLTYEVRTETTGRFPVRVVVKAPSGRVIGAGDLIVRSTAYSRLALLVVAGAALVLVARWARRFLPRRS